MKWTTRYGKCWQYHLREFFHPNMCLLMRTVLFSRQPRKVLYFISAERTLVHLMSRFRISCVHRIHILSLAQKLSWKARRQMDRYAAMMMKSLIKASCYRYKWILPCDRPRIRAVPYDNIISLQLETRVPLSNFPFALNPLVLSTKLTIFILAYCTFQPLPPFLKASVESLWI